MSFLGSIVSDIKSIATDPGKLVGDVANSILPSNMKAVGDILGGITDIETGNPLAALSHMTDALKDLPQLLQGLASAAGGSANAAKPAGTAAAEPSPPPPRATTASTPGTTTAPSSTPAPATAPSTTPTKAQTPTVTVASSRGATVTQVDDGTNTTRVTERRNGTTTVVVMNDATGKTMGSYTGSASNVTIGGEHVTISRGAGGTTTSIDNGTDTATVGQNGANATVSVSKDGAGVPGMIATIDKLLHVQTPAGTSNTPPASPKAAASTPAPTSGTTAASATSATASSSGSAGATATSGSTNTSSAGASNASSSSAAAPKDLASLMALSPDQFMQAVTSGKIPDDVANNQGAMMQVQARMNQITQMNQLVTSMMAAMHQMQMSIIQNIRC